MAFYKERIVPYLVHMAMRQETLERLTQLAESISTAERKVSPMQVAAQLLEDSLNRVSS